jgi:cytoskeletal protein CcmA (bactofilin family)
MFKRSEESEWSRFSKAFTGKEEKEPEKAGTEVVPEEDETVAEGTANPDVVVVSPTSNRPSGLDTNLSLATRPAASPTVQTVFSPEDIESTIGEHTSFDGTLRSDNSIRVRGAAQGEIECSKAVFIDENAKVTAKVTAASITVAGEVDGELVCSGRVEIRPSGRVTGTINAATLVMQEGAYFDGNLRMRNGAGEAVTPA